ncbi:uncharacterized protein LOC135104741 [Scylla paramamosain]|uniref:uncharacterized protein LOC135104741 n=1 Tax=Scylla paramamosain TaxID=85552 RepID=UPI003082F3AB
MEKEQKDNDSGEGVAKSTTVPFSVKGVPERARSAEWWRTVEPLWVTATRHNLTTALFNFYRCEAPWVSGDQFCVPAPPAPPPDARTLTPHLHHALALLQGGGYSLALVWASGGLGGSRGGNIGGSDKDDMGGVGAAWRAVDVSLLDLQHALHDRGVANQTHVIVITNPEDASPPTPHHVTGSGQLREEQASPSPSTSSFGSLYALGPMFRAGEEVRRYTTPTDIYHLLRIALHLPPAPYPANHTTTHLQDFLVPSPSCCGRLLGVDSWLGAAGMLWWWWCGKLM